MCGVYRIEGFADRVGWSVGTACRRERVGVHYHLVNVSERGGSALVHVNAAYTSQVDHRTGLFGVRRGDRLHCPGGVVSPADVNAAINVLARVGDPDVTLWTPHARVKQILLERADRQRARLPAQDSSPPVGRRANHPTTLIPEQV